MKDLHETIKEILNTRAPKKIESPDPSYVHASVLIPLFKEKGCHKVLFTERTHRVEHHKGQISFPGGAADADDASPLETALREAHEEVGLQKADVHILGRIDDTPTMSSNFVIHPFVGLIPHPYNFTVSEAEVHRLVKAPLSIFHPENTRNQRDSAEYGGVTYRTIAYEHKGDLIWGATARMMQNLMDIISHTLPLPREMK
ncbi:MAG: CoA pyrophosphatase [Deltaproteobacteria bacterium]|nr:CoA pyrophosphatase [Deltaproteobacteria bacterium]